MKKKINKKVIFIFFISCLYIASEVLPKNIDNLDEIWNFNFARCINNRTNTI